MSKESHNFTVMQNKREYIRTDERQIHLAQASSLFADGTFQDQDNDLFSETDLALFVENASQGFPVPAFGAREDELGNPQFKSGKFRQVIEVCHKLAESKDISPLASRKLYTGVTFKFVTISEGEFYNPGITREDIDKALYFYL